MSSREREIQDLMGEQIAHFLGYRVPRWKAEQWVDSGHFKAMEAKPHEQQTARSSLREQLRGEALAYLQSEPHRIAHRDIKPANILIADPRGGTGMAKLADFGLAKAFGELKTSSLTGSDELVGTLKFMAPEVLASGDVVLRGDDYEPAVDVYSMGTTFYFALTGCYPFNFSPDPRAQAIFATVLNPRTRTVPVRDRDPSIPAALASVIDRACAKEPSDRFADAVTFQQALAHARKSLKI